MTQNEREPLTLPRIAILGAGPAGLGAAYRLARGNRAQVTVLEQAPAVGGATGSFDLDGVRVDYGSHRLHRGCDPAVLRDIGAMLGPDLLVRPRHGSIRLQGRSVHFPLRPFDLALRLPPTFTLGVMRDSVRKMLPLSNEPAGRETFATVLRAGLGETICEEFYFPYARKIWGLDPEDIDPEQARRRVSAGSLGKAMKKVLAAMPGVASRGDDSYLYPVQGYGQICEAYQEQALAAGADIRLNSRVVRVEATRGKVRSVITERDGQAEALEVDRVWSTIPLTMLAQTIQPAPPVAVLKAAESMDYRALILIYLVLEQDRFGEYDAYYFPEQEIPLARCSEPKNFRNAREPVGRTVLCAELPCDVSDPVWTADDETLRDIMRESLARAGQPIRAPIRGILSRRLAHAYPMYRHGYADHFQTMDRFFDGVDGLLTFGRQGLFAHDNADQALSMAYAAVDCLRPDGSFDRGLWAEHRREFAQRVVQD